MKFEYKVSKLTNGLRVVTVPMGTTPHPNVLAGFIAISLIILYITRPTRGKSINKNSFRKVSHYITTILGIFTLLLTQSLTAIVVLIVGTLLLTTISPPSSSSKHNKRLPIILITLGLVLLIIWGSTRTHNILESTSISRRTKLNSLAAAMIKDRPFFGVGLNNFTAVMSQYGDVESTTRFFQPVHNIYLLLLSETGLIGFLLVLMAIYQLLKRKNQETLCTLHFALCIPLTMILIIGVADHYPLTLQQGLLMLAVAFSLAFTTSSRTTAS